MRRSFQALDDETAELFVGMSNFYIPNATLYFQDGLDGSETHTLNVSTLAIDVNKLCLNSLSYIHWEQ